MQIPGIFAFASNPPAFGFGKPVQFVCAPNFDTLRLGSGCSHQSCGQIKGLSERRHRSARNKPEIAVSFDRDRSEDLGVSVRRKHRRHAPDAIGSSGVSTFTRDTRYRVMVRSSQARAPRQRHDRAIVRGRDGSVQLSAVASIDEGVGPRQLNHFNRVRSYHSIGRANPGFTLARRSIRSAVSRRKCCPWKQRRDWPESPASSGRAATRFISLSPRAHRRVHGVGIAVRVARQSVHRALSVPLAVAGALATPSLPGPRSTCTARSA